MVDSGHRTTKNRYRILNVLVVIGACLFIGGGIAVFLLGEIPDAIEEMIEGANRVAEIVRAMKEFAHPGSAAKESVDVNRVIRTMKAVSRNEWKYVADMSPPVVDRSQGKKRTICGNYTMFWRRIARQI